MLFMLSRSISHKEKRLNRLTQLSDLRNILLGYKTLNICAHIQGFVLPVECPPSKRIVTPRPLPQT